jgi:hypothetical protein
MVAPVRRGYGEYPVIWLAQAWEQQRWDYRQTNRSAKGGVHPMWYKRCK